MRSSRVLAHMGTAAVLVTVVLAPGSVRSQVTYRDTYPQRSGEEIFRNVCQGCHMPDAKGAIGAGAYPALAANPRLAAAVYPITVLLRGQRGMPNFGEGMDDEQIASVLNYVRTHFGNHYKDTITPAAVEARRGIEGPVQPQGPHRIDPPVE